MAGLCGTSYEQKVEVLSQALPYIQKYNDKVVVIKYGGNAMVNGELKKSVMSDVVLLSLIGIKVVLVHGGGPEISETMEKMGKTPEFINGLRKTDKETMDIVQMVLAGKTNKELVLLLQQSGGSAVGLCGIDGQMILAKKLQGEADLGFVGEIVAINTKLITDAFCNGNIPVIATIGCDKEGNTYNINADTAAAAIASSLQAENMIIMTDVTGILENPADDSSLIPEIPLSEIPALIKRGVISKGMIPKANCCVEACRRGVKKAFVIDGRIEHSILIEMLTDKGIGTMIK